MKSRDERIAAFIRRCTKITARTAPALDGQWRLILPEPRDEAEEEALRLFVQVIEEKIGMPSAMGGVQ